MFLIINQDLGFKSNSYPALINYMFIFILNSVFNQFCVFSDSFAFEGGGCRGPGVT